MDVQLLKSHCGKWLSKRGKEAVYFEQKNFKWQILQSEVVNY